MTRAGLNIGACGNFLGTKYAAKDRQVACRECGGLTCGSCGTATRTGTVPGCGSAKHPCPPEEAAEDDPYAGLVQGRDFQICPNERRGIRVELHSRCNAMLCEKCFTSFCFLCAKIAGHDSDHWQAGKDGKSGCPRWNQPGAENARFDVPGPNRDELIGAIVLPEGRFEPVDHAAMQWPAPEDEDGWMDLEAPVHASPEGQLRLLDSEYIRGNIAPELNAIDHAHQGHGVPLPPWYQDLEDLTSSLEDNLDLYVVHHPVMQPPNTASWDWQVDQFHIGHQVIDYSSRRLGPQVEVHERYSRLQAVVDTYMRIGRARMATLQAPSRDAQEVLEIEWASAAAEEAHGL